MYWNRWLKEFIPTLTSRSKLTRQTRNFNIGDLVIIKSKCFLRNRWAQGRVIWTFVGSDDIMRSVKVKTPSTELMRLVIRLVMFRHILLIKDNNIFVIHLQ